ncbi:MAG: ribosomal protein L7/L12 [Kiritimatiellae bacterium]|nr:ribosomal protein L7/L12 [Kiritimatiellia bacterium]
MVEQPTPEQIQQIGSALADGRKIEAIKIYREATGKGLKEAKEFIDELVPRLQEQDPERYGNLTVSRGTGCAGVILFGGGSAAWAMLRLALG